MNSVRTAQSIVGFRPEGRPVNDFYPTPAPVTRALLSVEHFSGAIWEPACGDGAMSKALEAWGYDVVSTDIEPRGYGKQLDFFFRSDPLAPNIVTNPPFKLLCEFIERAKLMDCTKFAFLAKLATLEGGARSKVLERTKLTRVHVFRNRISMYRDGIVPEDDSGGMIAFAWFVWEKDYKGQPIVGWL